MLNRRLLAQVGKRFGVTLLLTVLFASAASAVGSVPVAQASEKCSGHACNTPYSLGGGSYTYNYTWAPGSSNTRLGFDTCGDLTTSQMQSWWNGTPYLWAGVYIGGLNWRCAPLPSYINSSWTSAVYNQGWWLTPIWVGHQPPTSCYSGNYEGTPIDPNNAYSQGYSDGTAASQTAESLSIGPSSVLWDDMENFNNWGSCVTTVANYIDGWVNGVRYYGFRAGVYSNISPLQWMCNTSWLNQPDDVWFADWNGNQTTNYTSQPTCDGDLQRLHQYDGNQWKTYNGVTLQVDDDVNSGDIDR